MFVTGPAQAAKSNAIEVAQQLCYEYLKSIESFWEAKPFYLQLSLGVRLL